MTERRIHNLDLFRALAISFVVFFHVTQMFAGNYIPAQFYNWGRFGVEFFFVLSGFLIGGLYYKKKEGVNLFRFWSLRILRTYPPYLIALILSFLAVYLARHQRFDPGYLIFLQNYYAKIPYFLVSWSLCVEEHFYLIFPLVIIISDKLLIKHSLQLAFWILLCILPAVLRIGLGQATHEAFGYYETASYFRFDGIAMGCLLAFLVYRMKFPIHFSRTIKLGICLFFVAIFAYCTIFKTQYFTYTVGYFLLSGSLVLLLATFFVSRTFPLADTKITFIIASMAYSIYLTHALVINFMSILGTKFHISVLVIYPASIVAVFSTGFIFFKLIEQPTLRFRNYYFRKKAVLENNDHSPETSFGVAGK